MRLVSQFGEIEYFKNLKYDTLPGPNAALLIFREEEAAQHCLQKSPIRFRMGRAPPKEQRLQQSQQQQQQPPSSPEDRQTQYASSSPQSTPRPSAPWGVSTPPHTQTRSISTRPTLPKPPPNPLDLPGFSHPTPATTPVPESGIFQIRVSSARASFRDLIKYSHFHGNYLVDSKSAAQLDLAKSVPVVGLSDVDWRAEGKPFRVVEREMLKSGSYRGSGRRKSLMEIYEEGRQSGRDHDTADDTAGETLH